ncbi:amidohydrolase [Clostridium lundense]|uniref:amidohydrolase n=1 Tax=Clostridium lundense TaxID=319475 RepID=UPI0004862867|nr:amidohydrolase [Clostridium lundense]
MNNIYKDIDRVVDLLEKEIIEFRRDFHKYAEVGWTEFRTSSKITEYLEKMGLEVKLGGEILNKESMMGVPSEEELKKHMQRALEQGAVKKYTEKMYGGLTGVVGILDTKIQGPTTAFRFDIDANDGIENNSLDHRPKKEGFLSVNSGAMHACGHDGHAAIGLTVAKVLKSMESKLCGKFVFIFQPAEEGARGAYSIVKSGLLDEVDYFLSGHIGFAANKLGQIVCNTDGFLSTTKFDVSFKGKSSHAGASPQNGKNALLGAASAALNLHTLCQHEEGATRINVGVLNAGTGRNVVPEYAEMKLETRGETDSLNQYVTSRAIDIIKGAAMMHGLEYKVKVVGRAQRGKSDKELSKIIEEQAKNIGEVDEIVEYAKLTGSEDATYMMNKVQENGGKAVYLMFGTKKAADHHNSSFDFDEGVLKIATKVYVLSAIKINERGRI